MGIAGRSRMLTTLLILSSFFIFGAIGQPNQEDCLDQQFHVDPDNCPEGYFRCNPDGSGGWIIEQHTCPSGTVFHPDLQICDWPGDWELMDESDNGLFCLTAGNS